MSLNNLGLNRTLPPTADFAFSDDDTAQLPIVTADKDAQNSSSAAKIKIPSEVTITVRKGDNPKEFELRALRTAARKAGLPLAEREKFAAANADGDFNFSAGDPTPKDDARVKTKDLSLLTGRALPYKLSNNQVADLTERVERYVADGGKLLNDKEMATAKPALPDGYSSKNGIERANARRAELTRKLFDEAQILPTSFGIPSKLTDLKPIAVTLPEGVAPTEDNALLAYIEKRFGGGNLFGSDKRDILNNAKISGVKVENLKINPDNNRAVSFNLSVESLLKLQKAYLDVQEKVNSDIDIADKTARDAALNQFLVGVMEGAWDDVKGNVNTVLHPLETLQGIRDAINVLSQLSADDLKNIVSELGNKAVNATPGEAAHAAGYVVGTIAVEAILTKGAGAALSALGKTRAGAEFLAKIGKLGELANLGKAKVLETFSDEAATVAKQKFFERIKELGLSPNSVTNLAADPELWARATQIAGNAIGKGYTKFADFSKQMVNALGESVKPHLEKLYRESLISLDLSKGKQILSASGKVIDDAVVKEAKEKVMQLVQENKVADLKEYLYEIGNKYGTDLQDELKQTVSKTVDGVFDGRRTPEVYDMLGGHTIYDLFDGQIDTKHVGKTVQQLRDRLGREPNLLFSSSFKNLDTANKAQMKFIKHYEKEIAEWFRNGATRPFSETLELGEDLGNVVGKGKFGVKIGTKVQVAIAKDSTKQGWHIVTSFPVH